MIFFDFLEEGFLPSLKFVLSLRGKYDVSINVYPSNRKEYNFINFLVGAKKRAAVKYLRKDFQNLGFLNNVRVAENDSLHNVQTNIKLAKNCSTKISMKNLLEFPLTKEDINMPWFSFNSNIKENDLVIGFHPGSATLKNHAKRRWEPEKFAGLQNF